MSPTSPSTGSGTVGSSATPSHDTGLSSASEAQQTELLSALTTGLRSANALPLGDDFEFLVSLPEVADALQGAQSELLDLLNEILEQVQRVQKSTNEYETLEDEDNNEYNDLEDPLLWEDCSEACEFLLEHAESYLQNETTKGTVTATNSTLQSLASHARTQLSRMVDGTIDMVKPQLAWSEWTPPNGRTQVFVPPMHPEKPHAVVPLDLSLRPGHGLETRFGEMRTVTVAPSIVAPSHHVAHVYEAEIKALEYADWQLEVPELDTSSKIPVQDILVAEWIDTPEALAQLVQSMEEANVKMIALDLEAHSFRSFAGITCLMQLSYKQPQDHGSDGEIRNALIDTLALRFDLNKHLQPLLADPMVVKILHGADSDIQWLQRDFGLYIVNLFDTGRAAKALGLPRHSYAYLLRHYVGIDADKSFQLADWRQRPLSEAMQQYAIQDTHYLLDIYERLKCDLILKDPNLLRQVLDTSKLVSLFRYAGEPFDPLGYKSAWVQQQSRRRRQTAASNIPLRVQERILASLWDWRDRVARERDESLFYVCGKQQLLRIATAQNIPTSVQGIQALFTKTPSIILENVTEILELISQAANAPDETIITESMEIVDDNGDDAEGNDADQDSEAEEMTRQPVGAPSSAFIKPSSNSDFRKRGMRSPVLATEALYRDAGWTTPEVPETIMDESALDAPLSTDDDGDTEGVAGEGTPKRFLTIHLKNKYFASQRLSDHSLAVMQDRQVNGLATVAASQANDGREPDSGEIVDQSLGARHLSAKITSDLVEEGSLSNVLCINARTLDIEDPETEEDLRGRSDGADTDEEEYPIPRSMREIYKISNRNRRNKKNTSPTPERGTTPTSETEREELAKAEELLRDKGLLTSPFFGDGSSKKQRTQASTGRESEETVSQEETDAKETRAEDLAVVEEAGWMSNRPEQGSPFLGQQTGLLDAIGSMQANPFFAGAALVGGPLAQEFSRQGQQPRSNTKRSAPGRGNRSSTRRERPEKKDGKTFHYRKR